MSHAPPRDPGGAKCITGFRSPAVALNLTGSACAVNGSNCRAISTDPTLQRDLRDQEAEINDDLSVLKLYPMLSVGFSWRFGDN